MPRKVRVPAYRLYKQSGQAVVTLPDGLGGRHDVLLGTHDSPESLQAYARVIGEWKSKGGRLSPRAAATALGVSVNELILAYFKHAQEYYRRPDGRPTPPPSPTRCCCRRSSTA